MNVINKAGQGCYSTFKESGRAISFNEAVVSRNRVAEMIFTPRRERRRLSNPFVQWLLALSSSTPVSVAVYPPRYSSFRRSGEKKSLLAQRNERGWRGYRGGQGAGEARKRHREIERRENEGVVGEGSNETNEGEIEREMETRGRSETRLSVLFVESGDETRGRK